MTLKEATYTILLLAAAALLVVGIWGRRAQPSDGIVVRPLVQTEALQAALEPGDTIVYTMTVTAAQTVMVATHVTPGVARRWHLR